MNSVKKLGRPPGLTPRRSITVGVRLDPARHAALSKRAAAAGVRISTLAAAIIDRALVTTSREAPEESETRVREGDEENAAAYGEVIVADPPPVHIRQTQITVNQVLSWMAAGQSESEILRRNPGLREADIRASLAYAADREKPGAWMRQPSKLERLAGKFQLPEPDPTDPRLNYLLERYLRNRS